MSSRREAREYVMKALYAHEQGGGDTDHIIYNVLRPRLEDDEKTFRFARRLFRKTVQASSEAEDVIRKHAKNWELSRIALIDRLLLRIAVCELLFFAGIPPKVTLNEAIEIAKKYSTDRSASFINGVLDAAMVDLQRAGRLKKSGRGLVGMESIRNR